MAAAPACLTVPKADPAADGPVQAPSSAGDNRHSALDGGDSGGPDIPVRLGPQDLLSVVLSDKPAIVRCVEEQKRQAPDLSGKLLLGWIVHPDGSTSDVTVQPRELQGTYIATCIAERIKGWKFPRHQLQMDPVTFPITF